MALSIIESRTINKRLDGNLQTLNAGGLSIIESRKLNRAIDDDLALLNGNTLPNQAPEPPPDLNASQDPDILFLQEVIAGQHDSDNVMDLAQKIIAAGDIVVTSDDALVAQAVDKWVDIDTAIG